MTAPMNDRREVLAAVLAEYREHMFRSEYRPEGRREFVIRSDIAQTVWQDMTRAALAAQEGERGGAEVAADERAALAFAVCPDLTHTIAEGHDVCEAATDVLVARMAGTLAKHDAEVLRAAANEFWHETPVGINYVRKWLRERADRIEVQP